MQGAENIRILVVDDEPAAAVFIADRISQLGYPVDVAHCIADGAALVAKNQYALALCDVRLDHEDGTAMLPFIKRDQQHCLTVFVTGFGSMDSAVRAIHDGAFDYISKPLDLADIEEDLKSMVVRAIKHREAMLDHVPTVLPASDSHEERTMVGSSQAMIGVYRALARAALSRENVLITGESGTGKELVARAIHEKSPWVSKPFVTVNCCALAENLLESELFGHVRGAFTGAMQSKRGLFEEADGGTLFLDEIGDISLALQVKLLRAIQEGEIKPVGSTETRKVDVRVITATHRNLPQFVQEGKFREDLFYRLKVISIEMPPLRERLRDIPDLIRYFAERYARRSGKEVPAISQEALEMLMQYAWPGNIRELENAISRATAMNNTPMLFPEDFPPEIIAATGHQESMDLPLTGENAPSVEGHVPVVATASATPPSPSAPAPSAPTQAIPGESLEELEKRHIAQTLQSVGFNKSKAADILGIDRVTLYRKAFKYGLISKGAGRKGTGSAEA